MGAGMFCVEGAAGLSNFSFRHRPNLDRDRRVFAAIVIKGSPTLARVLEGPVPGWKLRPQFPSHEGGGKTALGLPRFHHASFEARFPFAKVHLADKELPLEVTLTAWSPCSPGDADNASLPVAGLEYRFVNRAAMPLEVVFSFNAENILATASEPSDPDSTPGDRIRPTPGGFILYGSGSAQRPWEEGSCAAWVDGPGVQVNHAWTLDSLELLWRRFAAGEYATREPLRGDSAGGASLFVPFTLAPGEAETVKVHVAWYVPRSNLFEPTNGYRDGKVTAYPEPTERYQPWYAGRFSGITDVIQYWRDHYQPLRQASELFSHTLHDSTLPPEVIEAVSANLSILKSPTILRQKDGRLWGWEGSTMESMGEVTGIAGTSTHVWNYAQAIPHLFPELERGLRETEFINNQSPEGLQYCRTPLPIRPVDPGHVFPDGPAADGQLGGIIKVYRDWRISGGTTWLRDLWPRVRASLDYCIRTWDPAHRGWIEEPHFTTYDEEFWGADSFCAGLYLGALKAAIVMGKALGESTELYSQLLRHGVERMQRQLFNGEYFWRDFDWKHLQASFPSQSLLSSPMSEDLLRIASKEGPPYQYGTGCLSDGVMGVWLSLVSGIEGLLEADKVESHLLAVHRHNFRKDLTGQTNFFSPTFACNGERGLLVCSWPKGDRPSLSMLHSDAVWTGVEYQVGSHLIALGHVDAGLDIVRAARRRYDGRIRNPFCEVEAGYWYARAMSSYALLQAFSGARFDAVDNVLYLRPAVKGDFRSFLATATGYGTVGVKDGKPLLEVVSGTIPYSRIEYQPA